MKKNFVAAAAAFALLGAASAASATTFTGSYTANGNTGSQADNHGLPLTVADVTPNTGGLSGTQFSFNLNSVGQHQDVNLFTISTPDYYIDSNDLNSSPFSVTFNFTAPTAATGTVNGETQAVTFFGIWSQGILHWENNGQTTLNFGSYGNLLVDLDDVTFAGAPSILLDPNDKATVTAEFTLKAPSVSAVPEPMSWALMLTGFMGMGAALRFSRRQGMALTAA